MPQLLVRNVPEGVVQALKERARQNGRSAEAEHRALLEATLPAKMSWEEFWKVSDHLRELTSGRTATPAEYLIREDRDSR